MHAQGTLNCLGLKNCNGIAWRCLTYYIIIDSLDFWAAKRFLNFTGTHCDVQRLLEAS